MNTSDLVELFFSDVGFVLSAQSSEGALYLLTGFDVLCLAADHECHVLLQRYVAIPATTHFLIVRQQTQQYSKHHTAILLTLNTPKKVIY